MRRVRKFEGLVPATITVFNSAGEIDEERTKKFLQHLINEGVHGLFVGGSTGEYSLMTTEQRKKIIDIGIKTVEGEVPLFAGTGHNSTKIAVELSEYAEDAGADAVIASLPHYPKPTQEALYQHYKTIAEAVNIPVFVYSWPAQYGVDIEPETVTRLAENGYIQGIKDSNTNLDHTAEIIQLTGGKITVFEGYETKILSALCIGADGAICTTGNIVPKEEVEIYSLFRQGKIKQAREKQLSLFRLFNVLYTRNDTELLKEGIKMLGFDVGNALMPTSELSPGIKERLRAELRRLGKLGED